MILVVYSHICHFCLGDSLLGFNATFFLFRLPCFFFISGWLFEPVCHHPFRQMVRKKFMVQIVPTFIFLLLLAPPPEFFHQLGALKGGYWFTFVLFEFFILYMVIIRLGRRWSPWLALAIALASYVLIKYNLNNKKGIKKPKNEFILQEEKTKWNFYVYQDNRHELPSQEFLYELVRLVNKLKGDNIRCA